MSIISILALASSAGLAAAYPFTIVPRAVASFPAGTSWDILLSNPDSSVSTIASAADDNFQVIDIDLFDTDASTIAELKKTKRVICYFSAGTREGWRKDVSSFKESDTGSAVGGGPDGDWPDELWLDVTSESVKSVMKSRIEMAAKVGCDAVDPDNIDGYDNDTGFSHPKSSYIAYIKYMSQIALSHNLAIGLKNAVDLIPDVVDSVQFAINEQCHDYKGECAKYKPFTEQNKAVFNIEYGGDACSSTVAGVELSTLVKAEDQALHALGGACKGRGAGSPAKEVPVPASSTVPKQPSATGTGEGENGHDEGDLDGGSDDVSDKEGDEKDGEDSDGKGEEESDGKGEEESDGKDEEQNDSTRPNDENDHNDGQYEEEDNDNHEPNGEGQRNGKYRHPSTPYSIKMPHRWSHWRNGRWN